MPVPRSTPTAALLAAAGLAMAAALPPVPAAPLVDDVIGAVRGAADAGPAAPVITPFEEWAPADCPAPTGADPHPMERLVVHHTFAPVADTPADVLPALDRICELHTGRGMDTIAYHYVVDPWGGLWQGRGGLPDEDGAPPATYPEGAHVQGANPGAVGLVFIGDHQAAPPTAAALEAASELLAWLLGPSGLDPSDTVSDHSTGGGTARFAGAFDVHAVAGHRHSNDTLCPGDELEALLPALRTGVRRLLAGESPYDWQAVLAGHPRPAAARAPAAPPPGPAPVTEPIVPAPPPPATVTAGDAVVVPAPAPEAPTTGLARRVEQLARTLLEGVRRP